MKGTVKVEGLADLEQALRKLPESVGRGVLRRVAMNALEPMADHARRLAPDDPVTGAPDLHRSIVVSTRGGRGRATRAEVAKHTVTVFMGPTKDGYPQAIPQEVGTPHHPPSPYMRPAWDAEAMPTLERVRSGLETEIAKAAKRLERRAAKRGG